MDSEINSSENKKDILRRLNKIEGQIKGIQKMVESEKQCGEVLIQISAVRAATTKVGMLLLEKYSKDCILNSTSAEDKEKAIENLLDTVKKFLKFTN
ncbi:metal-sensitive transcriptional regulator [Clostridium akagii]|uniref:metal-sensitive transcriptional regulator n=1 Tax=Clostridium akagii TaxID=91623 RepID=UPI00047E30F6|nr:metal-sensitive transcriptional regulator [Clostridium akagii]